jgi:UTP-glucose-1-phosphate uridylyltransferase/mevalonate kinase
MESARLLEVASAGGFYSYAAGVAAYMLDFYGVGGIEIDNYRTTLPVKKGLSSSAAFCVLVARAFNQVYQLGLTARAEMEAAYQGETATPSRCGRMDQGCAYGQIPVMMTFDGDRLGVEPLRPGGDFYLLVADLCGKKDTVRILSDLNASFPFAKGARDEAVQRTLGAENLRILGAAKRAVEAGDAEALGRLMTEAQRIFDENLMPVCEELRSPKLHAVLGDGRLAEWVYGGKGVGSQGDGCVQFICRGTGAREALEKYLGEAYGMPCFNLDIRRSVSVRKAVIPVAGLGTRMFPYTKAVPKTFLPVVTPEGVAKPVIQVIIEEALSADVEQVALVIQPEDEERFRTYFHADARADTLRKLPQALREEAQRLNAISKRLTFIPQHEAKGLGHAVMLAEKFVGGEPFLLMLGDHLFRSREARSVARQIAERFQDFGDSQSMIGIYEAQLEKVKHYGTLRGEWVSGDTLQIDTIAEKPTEDEARMNLKVERHGKPAYFCVNGIYVLRPGIFDMLRLVASEAGSREIELTAALDRLRQREGIKGLEVNGEHYDTGLPGVYAETVFAYSRGDAR